MFKFLHEREKIERERERERYPISKFLHEKRERERESDPLSKLLHEIDRYIKKKRSHVQIFARER